MIGSFHDNHNHTAAFSPDAEQSLDDLVTCGIRRGLSGLTLTDHYDKDMIDGIPTPKLSPYGSLEVEGEWVFDFDLYRSKLEEKQAELKRSGTSFELLRGLEVGYIPYQTPEIWPYLAKTEFDSIILSVHCVDGSDIYYHRELYEEGYRYAYTRYLEHIVWMLESNLDFDIVGHLDYVARYTKEAVPMRYREFGDHFDRIFRLMLEQGKTFEINTRTRYRTLDASGVDIGVQDPDIVRRFIELGGEYVALSSDSHEDGNCGRGFGEAAAMLRAAGLRYLCHYKERNPVVRGFDI